MNPYPHDAAAKSMAGQWAEPLAKRISYLQASMAEEGVETREARIAEEVNRALQSVPGSRRAACMDALIELFPTWEMATVSFGSTSSAPNPQTPDELINTLCAIAPHLTAERKALIAEKLHKAGLVKETGRVIDGDALAEVQKRLKLAPTEQIDQQRLGRLFAVLVETVLTLEQLGWNVWKSFAPRSQLRRDPLVPDLRTLLKRSITGETEVSTTQVYQQMEKSRQLLSAILASMDAVGRGFAQTYQMHYSPEAVREAVRAEGKPGLFDNPDARAWQRHVERASKLNSTTIETEIREHMASLIEQLANGENR